MSERPEGWDNMTLHEKIDYLNSKLVERGELEDTFTTVVAEDLDAIDKAHAEEHKRHAMAREEEEANKNYITVYELERLRAERDRAASATTTSEVMCMYCGERLLQRLDSLGKYLDICHPVEGVPHFHTSYRNTVRVFSGANPADMMKSIGSMVRFVHRFELTDERIVHVDRKTNRQVMITAPPPPTHQETHPDEHMARVLRPLLTPHLEAIASAMHITEALGPMQQLTFSVDDDECSFSGRIIVQVDNIGDCLEEHRAAQELRSRSRGQSSEGDPKSDDNATRESDAAE